MTNDPDLIGKRQIFIVWTNTDLTEGRGQQIPIAYAELYTTAARVAEKRGVMGSNADVREGEALIYRGRSYAPVRLEPPTDVDKAREKFRVARLAALERAKALGLTNDEIELLRAGGHP